MANRSLLPDIWRGGNVASPLREMNRLQRRIDRMFDEVFTEPLSGLLPLAAEEFAPLCDVEETNSHYLVSFDLPGIRKNEVKIELQDNRLTISGERKREHKEEERGRLSRERLYGSFTRTFMLPSNINAEKVEATYDNGVLQVALPKTSVSVGKQIPIKEGKLLEAKPEKAA